MEGKMILFLTRSMIVTLLMAVLLLCSTVAPAWAVINVSVAPGGTVDIVIDNFMPVHTGGWGAFTYIGINGPFARGTTSRVSMNGISVDAWGSGNFNGSSPSNRVYNGETLRYTNDGTGLNTTVSISGTWGNGMDTQAETININITNSGASVLSINMLDPNPTVASSVRWQVKFDQAVIGVNAANFQLSGGVAGSAITGVSGSGDTWTVTAGTGTGTGLLGLNMINSTSVNPQVLGLTFTGQPYSFQLFPTIVTNPANVTVLSGNNATLSATVGSRTAGSSDPIRFQWYNASVGDKSNPVCAQGSATTSPATISCTVGPLTSTPANGYWVDVWNNDPWHTVSTDGKVTVNHVPVVTVNLGLQANRNSSLVLTTDRLQTTDQDQDASSLTYTVTAGPGHGSLSSSTFTQWDIDNGSVTYTPTSGYHGPDSFSFSVSDGQPAPGEGKVTGSIAISVNDLPTFVGSTTTLTVNKNAAATDIKSLLHVSDLDTGQTKTWSQSVPPDNGGSLIFSNATATSGSSDITPGGTISYTPASGFTGTETFTVQVSDGIATAARTITVSVLPTAPVATAGSAITFSGFTANWGSVPGVTAYFLDVATDSGFTAFVPDYNNRNVGNVTALPVTGLTASTPYYYRVRAYNAGMTSINSNSISLTTATSRIVTNNSDNDPGSLRQTIAAANPGDVITFDATVIGSIALDAASGPLLIDKDLTIDGPGAAMLTIDGGGVVRLFQMTGATNFTLKNLTLANGTDTAGGALADDPAGTNTTVIFNCVFSGNKASAGGAISAAGAMTISDSQFSGNSATATFGGAIYATGTLGINNALFSNNSAHNGGAIANSATMTLTNVTMNGNSAVSAGGGIFNGGVLTMINNTIAGNSADQGGGINVGSGTVNLKNSIVADNNATTGGPDIYGTVNSQGYNLIGTITDATFTGDTVSNITGQDPLLGALAANGGPTSTMALLSGSLAIDKGNCGSGPAADQRGMTRSQDGTCDIGAYERGVPAFLTASAGTPQSAAINTGFAAPLKATVADSFGAPLDGISVSFAGPGSGAGIVPGSSASSDITGVATASVTANSLAGSYTVTAAVDALTATYNLTNDKGNQTFTFTQPTTVTYGSSPIDLSIYATAGASTSPVTFGIAAGGTGSGSLSGVHNQILTISGAGTIFIKADQAGDANYNAAAAAQRTLTVNQAPLSITADAVSKNYGTADPVFTYSHSALANGDPETVITGALGREPGDNPGDYNITQGTLSAGSNYSITFTGAKLIIVTLGINNIIAIPEFPQHLVAGLFGAGIMRSTDSGATWTPASGQPANQGIKALLMHPANHATLFAATYGGGVFTSTDSGDTWSACANTGLSGSGLNVVSLAIDPSGKIYAGTEAGIFASIDCATWSDANTGLAVDAAMPPVAIAIDSTTPATLYAGLDGAGVYKSIDSGGTWTAASTQPANLRVKAVAIDKSDNSRLYAATYGGGVFASTDSGVDWTVCADSNLANLNLVALTMDANGRLYAATEAGVFVSGDGCATWKAINGGLP